MNRLFFVLFLVVFFASVSKANAHVLLNDPGHQHQPVFDTDNDGVVDAEDCSADNASISQLVHDTYGDDIDSNCDGVDGMDSDGDGYPAEFDCNEQNPSIHPDATEIPGNGIDEDCDGMDWAG